jgi:hypothetical protein
MLRTQIPGRQKRKRKSPQPIHPAILQSAIQESKASPHSELRDQGTIGLEVDHSSVRRGGRRAEFL